MIYPAPEERLAALREEIRHVSREGDRRWSGVARLACFVLTAPMALAVLLALLSPGAGEVVAVLGALSPVGFLVVTLGGSARQQGEMRRRRAAFQERVRALDDREAFEVLLPLSRAPSGEARDTAILLLRERGHEIPTELLPSDSPAVRGDEPTPARDLGTTL